MCHNAFAEPKNSKQKAGISSYDIIIKRNIFHPIWEVSTDKVIEKTGGQRQFDDLTLVVLGTNPGEILIWNPMYI